MWLLNLRFSSANYTKGLRTRLSIIPATNDKVMVLNTLCFADFSARKDKKDPASNRTAAGSKKYLAEFKPIDLHTK